MQSPNRLDLGFGSQVGDKVDRRLWCGRQFMKMANVVVTTISDVFYGKFDA